MEFDLSLLPSEDLIVMTDSGTGMEQKRAAMELGRRADISPNDVLLDLLTNGGLAAKEGAALAFVDLHDARAVPRLLKVIRHLIPLGIETGVFTLALVQNDIVPFASELIPIIREGGYLSSLDAADALNARWHELSRDVQRQVHEGLTGPLDDAREETWRKELVGKIGSGHMSEYPTEFKRWVHEKSEFAELCLSRDDVNELYSKWMDPRREKGAKARDKPLRCSGNALKINQNSDLKAYLSHLPTHDLVAKTEYGTDMEQKLAAIELERRVDIYPNDILLNLLSNGGLGAKEGAALAFVDLHDERAVPMLLEIIRHLIPLRIEASAFTLALAEYDIVPFATDLITIIREGSYMSTLHVAGALDLKWNDLPEDMRRQVHEGLVDLLDDEREETWRKQLVGELLGIED